MEPAPADPLVPVASDERETEPERKLWGLAGQLALPGAEAQLGLDGVAYAPAPPEPRSGEPSLGNVTRTLGAPEGRGGEGEPVPPPPDPADYERLLREGLNPPPPPRQLVLWDPTWDAGQRQLTLWPQMRVRRPLVTPRQAKCQRTRFKAASDVTLTRTESSKWLLGGVIACGNNVCPHCGRKKARVTSALLGVCFERHREQHPGGDHWMLTLGVPHRLSDGMERTNAWLYDACARFWDKRAWEHFAERWGIKSRVRVYDAVHGGPNGLHPHFHIALFPEAARIPTSTAIRIQISELEHQIDLERRARKRRRKDQRGLTTNAEREEEQAWELEQAAGLMQLRAMYEQALAAGDADQMVLREAPQPVRRAFLREIVAELLPAWRECLKAVGCPHVVNSHAIDLLPSENAESYFMKWGLAEEVGLSVEKDRSHLRLLDIVCAKLGEQSEIAAELYKEFNEVMLGRTWVTGMADACKRLGVGEGDVEEYIQRMKERRERELALAGQDPPPKVPKLQLVVRAHLWRAFLEIDHENVFAWLDETSERLGHDLIRVQDALDEFLWRGLVLTSDSNTS